MEVVEDEAAALAEPYTRTGAKRRAAMVAAVRKIDREQIPGDVVECGVWLAGNIIIARRLSPDRICWLYDTFTGMTEPGVEDTTRSGGKALDRYRSHKEAGQGWCAASEKQVRQALWETGTLDDSRIRFVVGDVGETLLQPENRPRQIALLRLDTDWYASTKLELEILYPLLSPGGVLIVDDYGHWQGARKAVDEYFGMKGPRLEQIDYTAVMLVKPC